MVKRDWWKVKWLLLVSWIIFIFGSYLYFWSRQIRWESLGNTFFRIFLLLLFLLVNAALGKKVCRWLKFEIDSFLESFLFSLGVGLAIFTPLLIGLGLIGLLNRWVVNLLFPVLFLLSYREIEEIVRTAKTRLKNFAGLRTSPIEIVLVFLLAIQVIFGLFGASVLPSDYDGLSAYLPIAKEWVHLHRLASVPRANIGANLLPFNVGILYAMALTIKDAILAKLIHFGFGILTTIGIYALGKKYFSRRVALAAAAIFSTIPVVSWQFTTAYIDLGFTFYGFLAFYALINWVVSNRRGWLIISAVMSGLALGSKYTGFLSVGILAVAVLVSSFLSRKEKSLIVARNFILFVALAGVAGCFWYLRAFIISGYSIFDFLSFMLKGLSRHEAFAMAGTKGILNFGLDHLGSYPSLFWNVSMHSEKFRDPGEIGLFFLAFLPLLIFPRVRNHKVIKFLLCYAAVYLIFWGWSMPYKRGLIPIFPVLSIMVAYIIDKVSNFNKFFRNTLFTLLILALIFQIFYLAPEGLKKISERAEVFAGLTSQEEYIFRNDETYRFFKYINENLSLRDKLFIMNEVRTFYCLRPVTTIVLGTLGRRFPALRSSAELLTKCKKAGVTHLVLNTYHEDIGVSGYTNFLEELIPKHLKIVYQRYPFILYKIHY